MRAFSLFICTGNSNLLRNILSRQEQPFIFLDSKKRIESEMRILLRYVPFKDTQYTVLYPTSVERFPQDMLKKLEANKRWMNAWWFHVGPRVLGTERCDFSSSDPMELREITKILINQYQDV